MRVGLIVPRYRHSAVARNQVKRRLRELTRLRLLPSGLPFDVVVRIRPEAYDAAFDQLTADIDRTLVQLSRWAPVAPAAPSVS
jgi:ribonuclease P protein component